MRPVEKGACPINKKGKKVVFSKYKQARRYLIDRIGEYCSYCERKIESGLAVEHVQPKDSHKHLELEWDNFLLGCTNCNSTKGKTDVVLSDYLWPHLDDTFSAFIYDGSGIVRVNAQQSEALKIRAQRMIDLCGLAKVQPKTNSRQWETASDRRFEHRIQAWREAEKTVQTYRRANPMVRERLVSLIETIVVNQGFWSIWMHAFKDFKEVQGMLIENFPGTRKVYFNS